ncbi:MAG: type II secretion system minor pseudopilin GspH [Chromatiales bacterium]|nr:type II secretion system minor pseudopilin GspH [Chromatiales bacterium]
MPRCPHLAPPSPQQGFTLLEILVVMLLLSILVAGAVLSIGDGGRADRLEQEARRLQQLINLASDESILQSWESGVMLHQQGYQFARYQAEGWQLIDDPMLRPRQLPEDMVLELHMDELLVPLPLSEAHFHEQGQAPQLLLFSSGERSPFELVLAYRDPPELAFRLYSPMLGPIRLEREAGPW